jgi:hypothetical protein
MSLLVRLNRVSKIQLKALAIRLGVAKVKTSTRFQRSIERALDELPQKEKQDLLMDCTDNRWLYEASRSPKQIRSDLRDWLKAKGIEDNEITEDSDEYEWVRDQGIELEEVDGDWDEDTSSFETERVLPSWIAGDGFFRVSASISGVDFQAQMVRQPSNPHMTALLARFRGVPPFSKITESLEVFLLDREYRLIDNRPPCITQWSWNPEMGTYLRPNPMDAKSRTPYLELTDLLEGAFQRAKEALNPKNNVDRTLLVFQLHSVADHAAALCLNNLAAASSVLTKELIKKIGMQKKFGYRIDLLRQLTILRGSDYELVAHSNDIRNALHHPEDPIEARFLDYQKWYDVPEPIWLVPAVTPSQFKEFLRGIYSFFRALGLEGFSIENQLEPAPLLPKKFWYLEGDFKSRSYLHHPIAIRLLHDSLPPVQMPVSGCNFCGMRTFVMEVPRCPTCCWKCGAQDAILEPTRACGHEPNPVFTSHARALDLCLRAIDELAESERYSEAVIIARLAFDIVAGAYYLKGQNFFNVAEKIGSIGLCLTVNRADVLKEKPAIGGDGRAKALKFISYLDTHGEFIGSDGVKPSSSDYALVREFLEKALDEFGLRGLLSE